MITACFARALQRCTSRIGVHFLLIFQEVILISKTRNQLRDKLNYPYMTLTPFSTTESMKLSSKGSSGTCIPEVLRHSSILLSRRSRTSA